MYPIPLLLLTLADTEPAQRTICWAPEDRCIVQYISPDRPQGGIAGGCEVPEGCTTSCMGAGVVITEPDGSALQFPITVGKELAVWSVLTLEGLPSECCDVGEGGVTITFPDHEQLIFDMAPDYGNGEPGHADPIVEFAGDYQVTLEDFQDPGFVRFDFDAGITVAFPEHQPMILRVPPVCSTGSASGAWAAWIESPACNADVDGDGVPSQVGDIIEIITHWGSTNPVCDLNFDGTVDVFDLILVICNCYAPPGDDD